MGYLFHGIKIWIARGDEDVAPYPADLLDKEFRCAAQADDWQVQDQNP